MELKPDVLAALKAGYLVTEVTWLILMLGLAFDHAISGAAAAIISFFVECAAQVARVRHLREDGSLATFDCGIAHHLGVATRR